MTQLESAKRGRITPEMRLVAKAEGLDVKLLARKIASGRVGLYIDSYRISKSLPSNYKVNPQISGVYGS